MTKLRRASIDAPKHAKRAKGDNLKKRVKQLEKQVKSLENKLKYVHIVKEDVNGLKGPHFIITGCNVHVRSGSGSTTDEDNFLGLGNLIVGYNEIPITEDPSRTGSHNLVVGIFHSYPNAGGVVFGRGNTASGFLATVAGGTENKASEDYTNVIGGARNNATGFASSISGGDTNVASGSYSSVDCGCSTPSA